MSKHRLYNKLQEGYKNLTAEEDRGADATTALRGGNSGCFLSEDMIAGADPRASILRYFGIEISEGFDQQLMFDAGLKNEDSVTEQLKAAGQSFLCEEEIPTVWSAKGIPVTGRPDVVVGSWSEPDKHGQFCPEYGIELKMLCSVWSVMKQAHFIKDSKPKTNHVIQAAHYSWQNDYLPWVLQYISRTNWAIPFYAQKPSKKNPEGYFSEPDHRALRKDDKGVPYTFLPFMSLYDLTWDNDILSIDDAVTAVTGGGINQYYRYVAECIQNKTVPEIQSLYDHTGALIPVDKNENIRYFKFTEARENSGFDTWLDDCRAIAKEANA